MKKIILGATGLVAIALGAYLYIGGVDNKEQSEIDSQDIKQLVNDYSTRTLEAESASITPQQLIVTGTDAKKLTYELPEDEFFLSIAPYVDTTHPCAIHSLSGCQGEMVNEEFDVHIVDKDGNTIVDKTMKSQSNGFIDLWLPRDTTYSVTIEHNGKIAESEISTFESDDTCISTMQLKGNAKSDA